MFVPASWCVMDPALWCVLDEALWRVLDPHRDAPPQVHGQKHVRVPVKKRVHRGHVHVIVLGTARCGGVQCRHGGLKCFVAHSEYAGDGGKWEKVRGTRACCHENGRGSFAAAWGKLVWQGLGDLASGQTERTSPQPSADGQQQTFSHSHWEPEAKRESSNEEAMVKSPASGNQACSPMRMGLSFNWHEKPRQEPRTCRTCNIMQAPDRTPQLRQPLLVFVHKHLGVELVIGPMLVVQSRLSRVCRCQRLRARRRRASLATRRILLSFAGERRARVQQHVRAVERLVPVRAEVLPVQLLAVAGQHRQCVEVVQGPEVAARGGAKADDLLIC